MDAVKIYEEAARKVGRGEINLKEFWKIIRPLRDVEVVRHGRWIVGKNLFRQCNRCGYERMDDNPNWDTNFCPNCGANMRGEKDGH